MTSSHAPVMAPLSPTLEARFKAFESSIEFLDLRIGCFLSIPDQNEQMVDSLGFTQSEVKAFREWQAHQVDCRRKDREYRQRYWSSKDIGTMLDHLSNKTTAEELKVMEQDFEYRQRPIISLGNCNGYNLRVCLNATNLGVSYESYEAMENHVNYEAQKEGDTRKILPLLLSLYRNQENGEESEGSPFYSGGSSEDSEAPVEPRKTPIPFDPTDSADLSIAKIFAYQKGQRDAMLKDKLREGEDSTKFWKFFAFEGRNRLKAFLPVGAIQMQIRGDNPRLCWVPSHWYLVMNMYDKRPWIVFNPLLRSSYGHEDIYYPPGKRMATFCNSSNMRSHARLQFSASGKDSASMDQARPYRRRDTDRETNPLPRDFWTNLFAGDGTFDREIRAEPFFQDNSFCLGRAVWDKERSRIYRKFDTEFTVDRRGLIDDYIHAWNNEEHPPTDFWTRVHEWDLHDYVQSSIIEFIYHVNTLRMEKRMISHSTT